MVWLEVVRPIVLPISVPRQRWGPLYKKEGKTMELIIQLVAGAVGGNVAGFSLKKLDQGMLINSIAGIIGGGVGGQILSAVAGSGALEGIAGDVVGGGVGGGIVLAIVGVVKNMMAKG